MQSAGQVDALLQTVIEIADQLCGATPREASGKEAADRRVGHGFIGTVEAAADGIAGNVSRAHEELARIRRALG